MTNKTKTPNSEVIVTNDEISHLEDFMEDEEYQSATNQMIDSARYFIDYGITEYPNKVDEDTYYSPYKHAVARRANKQKEYTVHYAFPSGENFPVATLWMHYKDAEGNTRPQCMNINLSRWVNVVIDYYEHHGYFHKPYERN